MGLEYEIVGVCGQSIVEIYLGGLDVNLHLF